MTSDFTEGHTPDELISFLMVFRNEYRKKEEEGVRLKRGNDTELSKKDDIIEQLQIEQTKTMTKNNSLTNQINRINKKVTEGLTWKERLTGKIKY